VSIPWRNNNRSGCLVFGQLEVDLDIKMGCLALQTGDLGVSRKVYRELDIECVGLKSEVF
jgi:hypothetical protein